MFSGTVFPPIVCSDGFKFSAQARSGCYCEPREDKGPWTAVEVGYPSEREELLMPYVEDESRPTDTVYGWVPVSVIREVITKHGGTNDDGEFVLDTFTNG
jgi:hypothetical protein